MKDGQVNPFMAGFFAIVVLLLLAIGLSFFSKEEPEKFISHVNMAQKVLWGGDNIFEYAKNMYLSSWQKEGLSSVLGLFLARKIFLLGIAWVIFVKLWVFAFIGLLLLLGIFLYRNREYFEDLYIKHKARRLLPFESKEGETILSILLKNPVPASIFHHENTEGGLLRHSLAVAWESARLCKARKLNTKLCFIAGLLHDMGKLLNYRKVKESGVPAPSPVGYKPVKRQGEVYKTLGINQEVANKLALHKLKKEYGLNINIPKEVWDVVELVDSKITSKELMEKSLVLKEEYLWEVLSELTPEIEKSLFKKRGYVFVLAQRFNEVLSEILLRDEPSLSISTKPDKKGVHLVAYSVLKSFPLVKEYEGKKADRLGLFDITVDGKKYQAVYIFKIDLDLPETQKEIQVHERGVSD